MHNYYVKLKKTFINKKFLGFCLIGVINTFNAAFFSWLAHLIIQRNVAANIGYMISLTINYLLNSKIVFRDKLSFISYLRFLISYIPNFIIYFLVTFLTINTMHLDQFWATVLATMAGGPITFVIIKLYAFGNNSKDTRTKNNT